MKTKQDILKEVYDHLRAYHGLHTQTEFAAALHITRPVLSSAMNGNEAYLTKNLFQKICAAYPGISPIHTKKPPPRFRAAVFYISRGKAILHSSLFMFSF